MNPFEAFYQGTSQRLLRYAYGLTGDLAEAQDLTQEAYARAWPRWKRLSTYDNPEAWLRTVVTRLVADRWRHLAARRRAPVAPPDNVPPPADDFIVITDALKKLPLDQRRALVLHYILDKPVADVAIELDTNVNTIKTWLSRGRANMAAHLSEQVEPVQDFAGVCRRSRQLRNRRLGIAAAIVLVLAIVASGLFLLRLIPDPDRFPPTVKQTTIPFSPQGRAYLTAVDGKRVYTLSGGRQVHAYDLATMRESWPRPAELGYGRIGEMTATENAVIVLGGPNAELTQDELFVLDPATGRIRFRRVLVDTQRVLFPDILILTTRDKTEAIDLLTGATLWTSTDETVPRGSTGSLDSTAPPKFARAGWEIYPGPLVQVLPAGIGRVRDPRTGAVLKDIHFAKIPDAVESPFVVDNRLYLVGRTGMRLVGLLTTGDSPNPAISQRVYAASVCGPNRICLLLQHPQGPGNNKAELAMISVTTGQELWRTEAPLGGRPLLWSGRAVSGDELYGFDSDGKKVLDKPGLEFLGWVDQDLALGIRSVSLGSQTLVVVDLAGREAVLSTEVDPAIPCSFSGRTVVCNLPTGLLISRIGR